MGQNQAKSQYASVDMVENDDNNNDTDNANDLTFVFHNDDGLDSNERVVHDQMDQKQRDPSDEPGWTIYQMQPGGMKNVIGTRRRFQPCQPLVNFAHNLQGPHILEIAAEEQPHQWVVFVDVETIVVWRDGLVNRVAAPQIAKKCRLVTDLYDPLGQRKPDIAEVKRRISTACDLQFSNSESWAGWCLYGDASFAAVQPDTDKRSFHVQWNDINVGESYRTLDEAIQSKRTNEQGGLAQLQRHFGVRVAHKGLVTCIQ